MTLDRKEYVSVADVEAELEAWIKEGGKADYITLSGSGEPTLHSRFGEVLQYIRNQTDIPAALLSNGTLFLLPEVRQAAQQANVVKVSLSAWDQHSFEHVNRPHPGLNLRELIDSYRIFRDEFLGKLWIEVFLIPGVNSLQGDVEKIAALVDAIRPDEVHLNTAVRPPAEEWAIAMPHQGMEVLANLFRPAAKVIAEFPLARSAEVTANENTILAMLKRRPCTAGQIAEVFRMHLNEVSKYIGKLSRKGQIRTQGGSQETFYIATETEKETL